MSVSYEQTVRAAEELRNGGQKPTVRNVYARVGGDYMKVQQHMRTWRQQEVPEAGTATAELTAALQSALRQEIAQQRRQAVLAAQSELQEKGEEVDDLTRENGRLIAELEASNVRLHSIELEHERLATEAIQLRTQAQALQARLDEALSAADRVRVDLAQVRLQAMSDATLIEALRSDVETRRAEIATERASRVVSDRSLAAANAVLDAQQGRVSDLVGRVQMLENERAGLQSDVDAERGLRHTAERERDIALERATAAVARAEDLAGRERELRSRR